MNKGLSAVPQKLPNPDSHPERLVKAAIKHHWNPIAIDLSTDRDAVGKLSRTEFTHLRGLLAQFGAGEQAVTDDLAPLAVILDAPDDQRFVATQLYDEARHAELFDRYWTIVIRPEEETRGLQSTNPTDNRWQHDSYRELFDRTANAMARLLEDDKPDTRIRAFCHYHLTIEGILAHTAYRWVGTRYDGQSNQVPRLPGLIEGFKHLRRDEGRHISYGMTKVRELITDGVDPRIVVETLSDLVPLVEITIGQMIRNNSSDMNREELLKRVRDAHNRRLKGVGIDPSDERVGDASLAGT